MARNMKLLATLSLVLMLLLSTGKVAEVQGRTCEKPSRDFKGACFFTNNPSCVRLCKVNEGLINGFCRDFKCICLRPC